MSTPSSSNGNAARASAAASVPAAAGRAVKPAPSYTSAPDPPQAAKAPRASSTTTAASSSTEGLSSPHPFPAPGPRPSDDALLSVARVLHRHILLSKDERDAALHASRGGWATYAGSGYGSTRSTPRTPRILSHMSTPTLRHSISADSPGWATPQLGGHSASSSSSSFSSNGNGANGSGSLSRASSHTTLGSPGFGSPYSSLSTPPQMPLDARALSKGLHPNDVDIFDIDHYLSRSYSVQVPLLARVMPVSLFEQRRQYHSVPTPPTVRHVWFLVRRLCSQAHLHAECAIIALIYIERLMETRGLVLTPRNWLVVLVTALLSASKVWDDHASFNAEFAAVLPIFTLPQLNHMERSFLGLISYELYISADTYSQYFYGLKSIQGIRCTRDIPRWYHAVGVGDGSIQAAAAAAAQAQASSATADATELASTQQAQEQEPPIVKVEEPPSASEARRANQSRNTASAARTTAENSGNAASRTF